MRFLYVVGARPNFVKVAPVLAEMRRRIPDARHVLVHTGQHYDRMMSDVFLDELDIGVPDHFLDVGSGSQGAQTARIIERMETVIRLEQPDMVLVPGDVTSTLAVTLVAAKACIPLGHIESGLRSYDRSMPEEINRVVADEFSEFLFTHSAEAEENLSAEGIAPDRIHFVGNTMIDTLVAMEHRFRSARVAERLGLSPGNFLLVTLHRPALVDGPLLAEVMNQLVRLAEELPVVFPVHPRTRKALALDERRAGVHFTDPLSYVDFLSLEADAAAVLTDSGGVQEETTYLGVPCFTLRDNTERPVTVRAGTNTLLGLDPERIADILPGLESAPRWVGPPELWDGRAAERIADVLSGVSNHPALVLE